MNGLVLLYFAAILSGFALLRLPEPSYLSGLSPFFDIVGVIAIIVFSFVILYMGVRELIRGK
ncbi:hypothetical protein [Bacillus methanolicus]|uniref:Putative membrane protein n=1 Tax=Bacillus methanolicus (strain MGA3 / ATCC 53907) TaxID=796606 RepID=I3DZT5_BACMM|nr:hypothetical protein [Bacillus methanolicus]AIE59814.1 putative membrane protein [Bacillus methanolicus MGA3]EIJ79756.1 hypothetical protein MGA3_15431 [Bacillus methanolicus MGA3]UQD51855.1 hypothetical protein C0971_07235 [Bacillus methanolicus]